MSPSSLPVMLSLVLLLATCPTLTHGSASESTGNDGSQVSEEVRENPAAEGGQGNGEGAATAPDATTSGTESDGSAEAEDETPPASLDNPPPEGDSASTEQASEDADEGSAALARSIVQVVVRDRRDEVRRVGTGFVVGEGRVLTAAHLVADQTRLVVIPLTTRAELVARVVQTDERRDLALLSVSGFDLEPLTFAKDGFDPGRSVVSGGVWSAGGETVLVVDAEGQVTVATAKGAVGRVGGDEAASDSSAMELIEHNAMIPAEGFGGPLINDCGEVVGLNRVAPSVRSAWFRRGLAPEGVVYALSLNSLTAWLGSVNQAFVQGESSCADALADAQAQADRSREAEEAAREASERLAREADEANAQVEEAQTRAEEAEERLAELQRRIQEAERSGEETGALREQLESALAEHEAAGEALARKQDEVVALERRLEQERNRAIELEQRSRTRVIITVAVAILAVALAAGVFFVLYRRRSNLLAIAQQEAAEAQQRAQSRQMEANQRPANAPGYLLVGETGDGQVVSLTVPDRELSEGGVVVGRSPRRADYLINDKTLSREHARLYFAQGRDLLIEDLDTTNGSQVNGRKLLPRRSTAVAVGDTLRLGAVVLRVGRAR